MRQSLRLFFVLIVTISFMSCVSTTIIKSNPSKAKVYIDDEYMGYTPYTYSDTKVAGTSRNIKLVKEGYKEINSSIIKNKVQAGPIAGGVIGTLLFPLAGWWPFLYVQGYRDTYTYELNK